MAIANIISAIGNNSSVYPLIVRDCGIEVPTKVVLTYNQNKKESSEIAYLAARERFLDEYSTSLVWLGGIPLIGKICDKLIKKFGFYPDVNLKLFKEDKFQGINKNIEKFKNSAPEAVKDLIKVKSNQKNYEKLLAGKFFISTAIPILFMGFILPKLIFASSSRKIKELREKNKNSQVSFLRKDKFLKSENPCFTGSNWVSKTANFTIQDKMAVTDGGYAVGRVITARNKNESYDLAFKMSGMLFLNFVAPKWIEKGLNKLTGVEFDPLILADKEFVSQIKNKSLNLPKSSSPEDIFKFIDNPANKNSIYIKYLSKFDKVNYLPNGVRDPRKYIDVKELGVFRDSMENFSKQSMSAYNLESFVKKAKFAKNANILTNVALSSFLLAYCLPKAQFVFRKLITGSNLEPGLKDNN